MAGSLYHFETGALGQLGKLALQSGQQVKIRQNAQGVVTGLTVESSNGPVLFTRQPDGSFIRAQ